MTEVQGDGAPASTRATAPKRPSQASKILPADSPASLPEVPTSHLVYELLKSGQLLGFFVVVLVFAFICVMASRADASYQAIAGTAKEILLPIVTLYLGFIFGQYSGKRRK